MKQLVILLFGLSLFLLTACGGDQPATDSDNPPATTETTDGGTTETATEPTSKEDPITDAVIQQACDCQAKAMVDGIFEPANMQECMGGKTMVQFVEALTSPNATEKENSDAVNRFVDRMKEKCPR